MKKCPFCGADIEDSARFCLYCMQSLSDKAQILLSKKKKPQWPMAVAAIIAVSLLLAILLLGKQSPSERETPSGTSQPETISTSIQTELSDPPHIHDFSVENTDVQYRQAEATCTAPAVFYYSCVCGEKGSGTFSYGERKEHTIVTDPACPATCVDTGLTEGSHCAVCNTVFSSQTQIPVINHTYDNDRDETCNVCDFVRVVTCDHPETVKLPAVSPTCTTGGLTEGKKCTLCQEILIDQSVLTPLGHTEVTDQAVAPTCTVGGKTEGKHCTTCNTVLVAQVTVDPKGHTEVIDPAVAVTCTMDGKTEGKHCSTCNTVLLVQTTVAAKGHTEVIDPAVAVTCTVDGKTQGKHCSVCKIILVYQQPILAQGHAYDSENVLASCSVCGAPSPHVHDCSVENTAVEYQKEAATCLVPAVYYYSCICGEKGSETFSSGGTGEHVIAIEPGYPATCDTKGLLDGQYCSVCQLETMPHFEIRELGHTFAPGDSLPTCLVCGDEGTVIVEAPDAQFFQNNKFQIDSVTYVIRRHEDGEDWEISVYISCTNVSSSTIVMMPTCSILFYDENGYWTGHEGCNYTSGVHPGESGTCMVYFCVPDSSDIYKIMIS